MTCLRCDQVMGIGLCLACTDVLIRSGQGQAQAQEPASGSARLRAQYPRLYRGFWFLAGFISAGGIFSLIQLLKGALNEI